MLKFYVQARTRVADAADALKAHFEDLRDDRSGAAMVEYALIVGLIAIVCMAIVGTIGTNLNTRLSAIATRLAGNGA